MRAFPLEDRGPAGTGRTAVTTTPAQPRRSRPSGRLHVRVSQPTIHVTAAAAARALDGYAGAVDPRPAHTRSSRCLVSRPGSCRDSWRAGCAAPAAAGHPLLVDYRRLPPPRPRIAEPTDPGD